MAIVNFTFKDMKLAPESLLQLSLAASFAAACIYGGWQFKAVFQEYTGHIGALAQTIERLDARMRVVERQQETIRESLEYDRSPVALYSKDGNTIQPAISGSMAQIRWGFVDRLRDDCFTLYNNAFIDDSTGRTMPAKRPLDDPLNLPLGRHAMSYDFRVPLQAEPGLSAYYEVGAYDCTTHIQPVYSPKVYFQILEDQTRD